MCMLTAILFFGVSLVGCGNKNAKEQAKETQEEAIQVEEVVSDAELCNAAVEDYLVNVIGKGYVQSDVCIPYAFVISADEGNPEDVLIWGDFWVFNYQVSGDTLKTTSGGNHPGLMHVKKTNGGYEVTGFDAVVNGAGNLESAKKIFGDKFDVYQEFSGAAEKREMERLRFTADYVKKHDMSVTMLQDYGWPAVELPQ